MTTKEKTSQRQAIDDRLLKEIDSIQLSERLRTEREQFFKREMEVAGDRAVLCVESWKETGKDALDVRWAKMIQKWAARLPIVIFKDQLAAGTETKLFRGVDPYVEVETPNVLEVMEKGKKLRTSAVRVSLCAEEDWEAIEEAARFFLGQSAVEAIFYNTGLLYDDWPEQLEKVGGIMRPGRNNQIPPVPVWETLLDQGIRAIIEQAQASLERVRLGEEPDARKAWFWRAVIISCEAVIHYAHRYSKLARELSQDEPDPERRIELQQIAESCERVPEYPARTLHEAIQSRLIWSIAMKWCRPNAATHESGRMDQYLYPYFMSDIRERRLSVGKAGELIGSLLSHVARRDGPRNKQGGQQVQGTLITNVALGGLTADGREASNELTYLILHMVGLIKYAEPHYTFRVNAQTPRWILLKALDTNRKVGGGQPQFMSDNRVIDYLVAHGEDLGDARDWMGYG